MVRTNVVIDEDLIAKVMAIYGLKTKREAVEFALKRVSGSQDRSKILALRGSGWIGDLDEMRRSEVEEI
jgi:Arc/MetJ family transcription regulator